MAAVARALAVLTLVAINLRTLLGALGAGGSALEQHLPGGSVGVGLTSTISVALIAVGAPVSAALVRRYGIDATVVVALVSTTVALVLLGAGGLVATAAAAALGGLAAGVVGALLPALAQSWMPRALGTAIGTMMAATSLGLALASVLVSGSLARWDTWSPATTALSVLALAGAVGYAAVSRRRARGLVPPAPAPSGGAARTRTRLPRWAAVLTAFLAAQSFVLFAQIAWLAPSLEAAGATTSRAGTMLGLFSALQVVAALTSTAWAQRRGGVGVLLTTASLVGFAGTTALLLALAQSAVPSWWPVATMSLGHGASFALANLAIAQRSANPAAAAATGAVVMFVSQGLGAFGPVVLGAVRDLSGGLGGAWLLLAGLAALQLVLAVAYARTPPHPSPLPSAEIGGLHRSQR